ncbi:23842_t:CDS:1, partial [Dentiscutata erythropus]
MSNENSVAIKKRHPDFYSPYDDHPSYLFAWKKSVLPRVIPQALLITAFSVLIVGLWKFTILKLGIKPNFIIIIAFVVSLLLAYRTNTAYD